MKLDKTLLCQSIINSCKELARLNFVYGTWGNISVRYKEGLLITPSRVGYEEMIPEDIVYVKMDGSEENENNKEKCMLHKSNFIGTHTRQSIMTGDFPLRIIGLTKVSPSTQKYMRGRKFPDRDQKVKKIFGVNLKKPSELPGIRSWLSEI